jgi:Icc-related predicted phosphoesterase
MKILALSDTHNFGYPLDHLPDADILIHAGDACMNGNKKEHIAFCNWMSAARHKYQHRIYVPGNHDQQFCGPPFDNEAAQSVYAHVLINESICIEGLTFYGSPITRPAGHDWYYFRSDIERAKHWATVPKCDVLVTHDPPFGIGDRLESNGENIGCNAIRQYVENHCPILHIFGHIHEGHGVYSAKYREGMLDNPNAKTTFINAAIRDSRYARTQCPWLIHITDGEVTEVEPVKL